jgi:hypothetical protein
MRAAIFLCCVMGCGGDGGTTGTTGGTPKMETWCGSFTSAADHCDGKWNESATVCLTFNGDLYAMFRDRAPLPLSGDGTWTDNETIAQQATGNCMLLATTVSDIAVTSSALSAGSIHIDSSGENIVPERYIISGSMTDYGQPSIIADVDLNNLSAMTLTGTWEGIELGLTGNNPTFTLTKQ